MKIILMLLLAAWITIFVAKWTKRISEMQRGIHRPFSPLGLEVTALWNGMVYYFYWNIGGNRIEIPCPIWLGDLLFSVRWLFP